MSVYTQIAMSDPIDLSESRDCLCLASRRAALAITRAFERELRPHGIRATQYSMLSNLIVRGPMTVGALAEVLGVERTTLTRNLALTEAAGWASVRPGRDARERVVSVTPAGRKKIEAAFPAWQAAQKATTARIGEEAATSLRRLASERLG